MYPKYTNFKTRNEEEFNFLMRYLEKLGHIWESGDAPTYYINVKEYWGIKEYHISAQGFLLCYFSRKEGPRIHVQDLIRAIKKPSIFKV
jgi:hypothetical protein